MESSSAIDGTANNVVDAVQFGLYLVLDGVFKQTLDASALLEDTEGPGEGAGGGIVSSRTASEMAKSITGFGL